MDAQWEVTLSKCWDLTAHLGQSTCQATISRMTCPGCWSLELVMSHGEGQRVRTRKMSSVKVLLGQEGWILAGQSPAV